MTATHIIIGLYFLNVMTGWAMLLNYTNEPWWAAYVPVWGVFKRFKALDKLAISTALSTLDAVSSFMFSMIRAKSLSKLFISWLLVIFFLYLYMELLMHVTLFWRMGRRAGKGILFSAGMVLCPPLFMTLLRNQFIAEVQAIQAEILKCDLEKKANDRAEQQWLAGPPVWKCSRCGALWPMTQAVCKECGEEQPPSNGSLPA